MNPSRDVAEAARQDIELVRRMADGDEAALAHLYDRHAPTLLATAMHMLRDIADAEDLVHDVFMEAWRKAASFDPTRGSARAWLLVRLRSRGLDRLRAGAARRDLEPANAPTPSPAPAPGADASHDDGDRVLQALRQLPDGQREVMERVYLHGHTAHQVATALGIPTGTVKSRVRLALGTLRNVLGAGVPS